MKELLCLTFISVFLIFGGVCRAQGIIPTTPAKVPTTTTAAPTTTTKDPTTTAAPTTTKDPTTTVAPTTTATPTTADPPTTVAPNTTTAAPNTTAVVSTTPVPTTPVVPPTPVTPASAPTDTYSVNKSTNGTLNTCLVMVAAIEFEIPYEEETKNSTYKGVVGKLPTYNGTCSAATDTLTITSGGVKMVFTFKLDPKGKQYSLTDLKLTAKTSDFPNGKNLTIVSNYTNSKTFQLDKGDSYYCQSETRLPLSFGVSVTVSKLKMEAFRTSNDTTIAGKRVLCPGDQKTNSIVPIAVGAALAGLVVVVLIAYLIGRKRSRRGYESV